MEDATEGVKLYKDVLDSALHWAVNNAAIAGYIRGADMISQNNWSHYDPPLNILSGI